MSTALLDTHVLVWMAAAPERLSRAAKTFIADANRLAVSTIIAFEYEDLRGRGRLPETVPFADLVEAFELEVVPLPADVWRRAASLPNIHQDPVDRMLLAHGEVSDVPVITADGKMLSYPIATIW